MFFIKEFSGTNIQTSTLALFALSNLCIDYDELRLIELKSQFI